MPIAKRDNNELRYNSIWLLSKSGNPDYYKQLFRNSKGFFFGMGRADLVKELDKKINQKIEKKLGVDIHYALLLYKNLPYLNSFTRCKGSDGCDDIRKYDIERWLDSIEKWIFETIISLEGEIIFSIPPKQYV